MRIVARYSFNNGEEHIASLFPLQLQQVESVVSSVDACMCKTKKSREQTQPCTFSYSSQILNDMFKKEFTKHSWIPQRVECEYQYGEFSKDYVKPSGREEAFREIDFLSPVGKIGVGVLFSKFASVVYDVCTKMTIFHKLGVIDCGVEIAPVMHMTTEMSTGVSYFEQIAWDLEHRGVSNIDIPVLILGVDA